MTFRKFQAKIPGSYGLTAVILKKTAGGWVTRTEPAYIKEETGSTFKLVTVKEGEIGLPENKYARVGNAIFLAEVSEGTYRSLNLDLNTGEITIAGDEKLQMYKNEVDKAYRKYREGKPTFFDKWGTPIIIAAIVSVLTIPTYIMYDSMVEMNKTNAKVSETQLKILNKLDSMLGKMEGNQTLKQGEGPQPNPPPS